MKIAQAQRWFLKSLKERFRKVGETKSDRSRKPNPPLIRSWRR